MSFLAFLVFSYPFLASFSKKCFFRYINWWLKIKSPNRFISTNSKRERSGCRLYFRIATTTKVKTKKFGTWYLVISLLAHATKETKETNEDGSYIIIAMQIGSFSFLYSTLSSVFGMLVIAICEQFLYQVALFLHSNYFSSESKIKLKLKCQLRELLLQCVIQLQFLFFPFILNQLVICMQMRRVFLLIASNDRI